MEDTPVTGPALGNQYALHALRERRAEMTGELIEVERRARYLRGALKHLDATLAFMAPGFDPTTVKPKKLVKKSKLFGAGKLNQFILGALRKAERPLSLVEIAQAVARDAGFGELAVNGLKPRVRSNLLYLTKVRGRVVKDGERERASWALSP